MKSVLQIAKEYLATLDPTNLDRLAFDGKNSYLLSEAVVNLTEENEKLWKRNTEVERNLDFQKIYKNQSQAIREAEKVIRDASYDFKFKRKDFKSEIKCDEWLAKYGERK